MSQCTFIAANVPLEEVPNRHTRAMSLRDAVKSGVISQAEAKTNPYVLKIAMRQLSGWTSAGLGRCIQTLAWADEQSKTNGGDPVYALERAIILIGSKGREH